MLPFQITCRGLLYRVDLFRNLEEERAEVKSNLSVRDSDLPWRGSSDFTLKFEKGYEVKFYSQVGVGQSTWEDKANSIYVSAKFSRTEADGSVKVLAYQEASSDSLNAKWKAEVHGSLAIVEAEAVLHNTEIDTAIIKASRALGRNLSGNNTTIIKEGYVPNGAAESVRIRCTVPTK